MKIYQDKINYISSNYNQTLYIIKLVNGGKPNRYKFGPYILFEDGRFKAMDYSDVFEERFLKTYKDEPLTQNYININKKAKLDRVR